MLTTVGSLGDVLPLLAVASALQARGASPLMAVAEDHVDRCRAAGIDAVAVLPGFEEIARHMGLSESDAAGRLVRDQRLMLEEVILRALSSSAAKLDAVVKDADAIVSPPFMLAAPIIAEKRGLPLISMMLQPMAMLSAFDPPCTPDFRWMRHAPVGPVGRSWNRAIYAAMRSVLAFRYGSRLDAVRAEHGLSPIGNRRMLEAGRVASMTLCCYSHEFGPLQPDAPGHARLIGFPSFCGPAEAGASLPPDLEAFLRGGSAPIVFTLGSFAVRAAGDFYAEAEKAARRIGARMVLLTGSGRTRHESGLFACDYAPHSLLFPRASAVVHHGGVGTIGQALRAGLRQLVVPQMGDQHDNARRVARMGVGRVMRARRFTAGRVAAVLETLLENSTMAARAREMARAMDGIDAAGVAATAILDRCCTEGRLAAAQVDGRGVPRC